MEKKYIVRLDDQEREELRMVVAKLSGSSQKVRRANILLQADVDGPGWTDQQIADAYHCRTKTAENVRQRFVERGFRETLEGRRPENPPRAKLLDGKQEAKVIATRLGKPPAGYANWTLRLLAEKVVELEIAESISPQTVMRTLKKNGMTKRKIQYWVIPPQCDAEFVANMEDVLSVYEKPYNAAIPVLCMDEQPVQLVKEIKTPIEATVSHARRVDYEYERAGTANVFMLAEPLAGWRKVVIRETKTKIDFAVVMAELLENRYADREKVIVVCDNLNTHTKGSFYEAFEPERAFALASRIEFHYTPKHGSWLNIAENELSSMTRQCVANRRIGDITTLKQETSAWANDVSIKQRTVDWQMRLDDARCKLKSAYPKIVMSQP